MFKIKTTGKSNIPISGGALLVANHASFADFIIMCTAVSRPVHFIMNADFYNKPMLKRILKALNCIPISPRNGKNDLEAFNSKVIDLISEGKLVAIFAEGTVTRTGQILEFRKGVEHLSTRINGPVIPMHFDNVIGTPFTYRAGKSNMVRFRFAHLGRLVRVRIGKPSSGGITAFSLRQRVKELEAENFTLRVSSMPDLSTLLLQNLHDNPNGTWKTEEEEMSFKSIPAKLQAWDRVLGKELKNEVVVAILLPRTIDAMICNLWLITRNITVVNLSEWMSNEERFYICNKAGARTMITTSDLEFSRFAPNAERIIYIEDIRKSLQTHTPVHVICRKMHSVQRSVNSLWTIKTLKPAYCAFFFERGENETWIEVGLTQRNILAAITGLRQVYFFEQGKTMWSALDLCHAFGFVVQLILPLFSDLKLIVAPSHFDQHDEVEQLFHLMPDLALIDKRTLYALNEMAARRNMPFRPHLFTANVRPDAKPLQELHDRGIHVWNCLGMNTTSSVFAINVPDYHGVDVVGKPLSQEASVWGSNGKALPGLAISIRDANGEEVGAEVRGEIWIYGTAVADQLDYPNTLGWMRTSMFGKLSHSGFLFME